MTRKKHVELIEENILPSALIIPGGKAASYLSEALEERGCKVEILSEYSHKSSLGSAKFDYVFLFGNFSLVGDLKKHLRERGKFLFLETENEEGLETNPHDKIKILRLGDLDAWNVVELTEKIFKTIFSKNGPQIIDVRKKSHLPKTETVKKITPKEIQSQHTFVTPPFPKFQQRKVKAIVRLRIPKLISIFFFSIFILSLIIGGSIYWYVSSLNKTFSNFKTHLASGDMEAVANDFKDTKEKILLSRKVYEYSYKILIPLRETSFMRDTGVLIVSFVDLLQSSENVLQYFQKFKMSSLGSFTGDESVALTESDFKESSKKIENLILSLASCKKRVEETSLPYFPKESFIIFLNSSLEKLVDVRQILPMMEKVLITDGPKTYLVLLQNNMELRPTGGFIGSFALATVDGGKVTNFKIIDVYTADGQLRGHVEPPFAIRKYLSQPNWFLRDSNFDPDFAKSAVQATWFLQKEMGVNVDTVIGVNLFFIQNLLRLTGPLTLSDFGSDVVTADNFFLKAQNYVQSDFFPGSTQKKDYLTAITRELQLKLTTDSNLRWFEILRAVKNSLDEKNILIYAKDESLQQIVESQSWAGRMINIGCVKNNGESQANLDTNNSCFPDYIAVIDSNFGVNKVNYFVSKTTTIEKIINLGGQIATTVTLSYENKSVTGVFNGGHYVDYIRIFVPEGAKLLSATLNNSPISPSSIDIEKYSSDKTSFGTLLDIAPDNRGIVKFSYVLPNILNETIANYQFFFQKQGGDKVTPLIFSLLSSRGIKVTPLNFRSTTSRNEEVFYSTDTSVDRVFALEVNR